MAKIVKENINEAFKYDDHVFDVLKIGPFENIWVGKDGILGYDGHYLSWNLIKNLARKYNKM